MYWVNYYICIGYICCPTHIYVPQYIYPIHIPNTYMGVYVLGNTHICIGYICWTTRHILLSNIYVCNPIHIPNTYTQYIYPIHIPNTYGRVRMKYICWTTGYMLDFGVFRLIFTTFHDRFYFSHNTKKNLSPFCLLYLLDSSRSNFKNGLYIYL